METHFFESGRAHQRGLPAQIASPDRFASTTTAVVRSAKLPVVLVPAIAHHRRQGNFPA